MDQMATMTPSISRPQDYIFIVEELSVWNAFRLHGDIIFSVQEEAWYFYSKQEVLA